MYNAEVFIGNPVGGHTLLSTIMPLVTYVFPKIFPLEVITVELSTTLNKHTINPTPGWGLYMGPSRPAGRRVGPFHGPRG
jgi:hypothetical protein